MFVNIQYTASLLTPTTFDRWQGHEAEQSADGDGDAMHERLVAYVHALAGAREPRTGVWVEHSYARPRGAGGADGTGATREVRVLLAPRAPAAPTDVIDVDTPEPPPLEPPDAPRDPDFESDAADRDCGGDDDWEARVAALAPTASHAKLADAAFDILRRLRLARLAGRRAVWRQDVAAAARRLRFALASVWAAPGAPQQRPPAWLHAALHAYLPRHLRPLYEEVVVELKRVTPVLADRLLGLRSSPQPPSSPTTEEGGREGIFEEGPTLLWLRTGRERLERRWERPLAALMATRSVDVSAGCGNASPPESWCAAAVGAARAAVADAVAAAGGRGVIVGGVGAGAAVSAAAATGAPGVRGALLLAPALLTPEGPRDAPDDPFAEVGVPLLLVVGTNAGNAWRGAARAVAAAGGGLAPRRLVEVRGADQLLRLGGRTRRRLALSRRALQAAVAEECARWAADVAEGTEAGDGERPRRRPGRPTRSAMDLLTQYSYSDMKTRGMKDTPWSEHRACSFIRRKCHRKFVCLRQRE